MYDGFQSYFLKDNRHYFDNPQAVIECYGLKLYPSRNSRNQLSHYGTTHKKIRIKMYKTKTEFSGSFHTSSKSHNAGAFNMADLKVLLRQLKLQFGEELMKSKITRLEYGLLVLNDQIDWIRYKNRFVNVMYKNSRVYGQRITLTDFELKRYDKLLQMTLKDKSLQSLVDIPKEGFRLEIKIFNMKCIRNAKNRVDIYTVEDLLDIHNLKAMHEHFTTKLNKVTKESNEIDNKLRDNEKLFTIYAIMNTSKTNEIQKKKDSRKHKYYNKKLSEMINKEMSKYNLQLASNLNSHFKLIVT